MDGGKFAIYIYIYIYTPRGKESTEVRKSQNKGKESENSYQKLKRSPRDGHTKTHGNCIFVNRKRVNVCEHTQRWSH